MCIQHGTHGKAAVFYPCVYCGIYQYQNCHRCSIKRIPICCTHDLCVLLGQLVQHFRISYHHKFGRHAVHACGSILSGSQNCLNFFLFHRLGTVITPHASSGAKCMQYCIFFVHVRLPPFPFGAEFAQLVCHFCQFLVGQSPAVLYQCCQTAQRLRQPIVCHCTSPRLLLNRHRRCIVSDFSGGNVKFCTAVRCISINAQRQPQFFPKCLSRFCRTVVDEHFLYALYL